MAAIEHVIQIWSDPISICRTGPDITPYRIASSIDVIGLGSSASKSDGFTAVTDFVIVRGEEMPVGMAPDYILVEGQTFSKAKLSLDNHVYKNCAIDDCDVYFSGGQYELLDTHITNSRLILNHPAKGMYNAVQIFKMKSPGSSIIFE